jgi:hypothetical protein
MVETINITSGPLGEYSVKKQKVYQELMSTYRHEILSGKGVSFDLASQGFFKTIIKEGDIAIINLQNIDYREVFWLTKDPGDGKYTVGPPTDAHIRLFSSSIPSTK